MDRPSLELLRRLAAARAIPMRPAPSSGWMQASDGVDLHYLDWAGGPETLILLHGGSLSAHSFDLLALAMGEGVRCVALDLRGHGLSGWADSYPVERAAADVIELADRLGVATLHLAGMSLGGCVAGHAAPGLGARLASLAFIDVGPDVRFAATARMRAFMASVRPATCVEEVVRWALAVSPRTDPDLMLYRYQSLLKPGPEGFVWRADRRRPTDFAHILGRVAELAGQAGQVQCPVLVVKGRRSRVLSRAAARAFADRFPRGDWAMVSDAGHNIQEDQPLALAATLRAHIQEMSR
ncbi:alpha/beta hydrolase [Phenylobacterium sp.]|uniref:alpha/beta fold hydrolase n=1 Tax=Phenylobacterium sp. TaxID=1871053 RepID=UPI00286AF714|nr:alpha/beta hydrolase [Phenylobacterium sp.]